MCLVDLTDVDTVDLNKTAGDRIKSLKQFCQSRLTGTGTTHKTNGGSGRNTEFEIFDDFRKVRTVTERNILKLNLALEGIPDAAACRFSRCVHHNTKHTHRERDLLIFVDQSHHLDQWSGDSAGKHLEGDKFTDRNGMVKDQMCSHPDDTDCHHHFEHLAYALSSH